MVITQYNMLNIATFIPASYVTGFGLSYEEAIICAQVENPVHKVKEAVKLPMCSQFFNDLASYSAGQFSLWRELQEEFILVSPAAIGFAI